MSGRSVERWGVFELVLDGPSDGNPFVDVVLRARMTCGDRSCEIEGFYDGEGTYRVRFSPDEVGEWTYRTESTAELHGRTGVFECVPAKVSNHGPVRVADTFHFSYADGTPYYPFGTTSYAWTHQGDQLEEQTLRTLSAAPFNKIRMCVFPKHYPYNRHEPTHHPFQEAGAGGRDLTRFAPALFGHFEHRLLQLLELGIEADVILWHPYDRWGYATMGDDHVVADLDRQQLVEVHVHCVGQRDGHIEADGTLARLDPAGHRHRQVRCRGQRAQRPRQGQAQGPDHNGVGEEGLEPPTPWM